MYGLDVQVLVRVRRSARQVESQPQCVAREGPGRLLRIAFFTNCDPAVALDSFLGVWQLPRLVAGRLGVTLLAIENTKLFA